MIHRSFVVTFLVVLGAAAPGHGQTAPAAAKAAAAKAPVVTPAVIQPPADYVIGADDQLEIVFWREKEMSGTVIVRPDGKISLPLLNDVDAAGLTPEQLRVNVVKAAEKLVEEPSVTIVVKTINSRKVFITGQVGKPGPYPLLGKTSVLQLIATAGGLNEYAAKTEIRIVREEAGKTVAREFNYENITKGRGLEQNIELKPGDTIIVP